MNDINYDDPINEMKWYKEQRQIASEYLVKQQVKHGLIGESPAWFIAPYVSIWAIQSLIDTNKVGWWVISGDLPTDYISSKNIHTPREAMKQFSINWNEASRKMENGTDHPLFETGSKTNRTKLLSLLKTRSKIFFEWYNDEDLWVEQ